MPDSPCKFFLTTPIYYVNARPHIGHAYTTIVADVLARRSRAQGIDTWFLTGTDEHGQKIERSALAAGVPPQEFTDQVSAEFRALWKRMGITNDDFIRTTEPRHKRGAQKLFADLHAAGHIYLSTYTGQYSIGEEMFVEGPPGTIGPDGRPTETVTEENFFFRLSAFQLPLIDLIESNTLKIRPESSRNEVLGFLRGPVSSSKKEILTPDLVILSEERSAESKDPEESNPAESPRPTPTHPHEDLEPTGPSDIPVSPHREPEPTECAPSPHAYSALDHPYLPGALRDLSVSRSSFTWGIPVPEPAASEASQKHVIYVWLDALANYMTAVGYGSETPEDKEKFEKYWPANLHLVGKEITRFHCVYWPAFLLAAGLPIPKEIVANGWLLFDNSKMSKSKGNIVRTETILDAFGTLCPVPLGAPSSTGGPIVGRGGVSDEVRPLSPESPTHSRAPFIPEPHPGMSGITTPNPATASHTPGYPTAPLSPSPAPLLSFRSEAEESASALALSLSAPKNPDILSAAKDPCKAPAAPPEQENPASSPLLPTPHQRDLFAADVLRYYLLREIPFGQDGSFSFEALVTRYNADLANGYGNLVSRTLKLVQQNLPGGWEIPQEPWLYPEPNDAKDPDEHFAGNTFGIFDLSLDLIEIGKEIQWPKYELNTVLSNILAQVGRVDSYLSFHKPWSLAKSDEKVDRQRLAEVLYTAAESIRIITALLYPILPYATTAVWRQLGLDEKDLTSQSTQLTTENVQLTTPSWGGLKPGTKLGPLGPIFPRADKGLAQIMTDMEQEKAAPEKTSLTGQRFEAPAEEHHAPTHPAAGPRTSSLAEPNPGSQVAGSTAHTTERPGTPSHAEAPASGIFGAPFIPEPHPGMSGSTPESIQTTSPAPADSSPQITIDDFAKVELRVARILVCERIPKADKLLRLEVDLGYEKRQILSGIAEWYAPGELIGRRIVVITNLAPRKMRGLESHGMLLAASTEGGKPHLATFAGADSDSLPLGSRLK